MTNLELVAALENLVREEKRLTLEVIKHLQEVELRGIHFEMGYSSLFEFGMEHLKYSEGEIMRRLNAMRLLKSAPETEEMIRSGELSLTVAALAHGHMKRTGEQAADVIARVRGKSSREAERALGGATSGEKIKPLPGGMNQVTLILSDEAILRLSEIKVRLQKKNFSEAVTHALLPSAPKVERKPKITPNARKPTTSVKRFIFKRDKNQCTYVDPHTRRRCQARNLLEIDHVQPWSLGGKTTPQNLRLLCRSHNQHRQM